MKTFKGVALVSQNDDMMLVADPDGDPEEGGNMEWVPLVHISVTKLYSQGGRNYVDFECPEWLAEQLIYLGRDGG